MDGMKNDESRAAPAHHLFKVAVGELIAAVPPDAKQEDVGRIVAPLERRGI